jgi:hypothetical protein
MIADGSVDAGQSGPGDDLQPWRRDQATGSMPTTVTASRA